MKKILSKLKYNTLFGIIIGMILCSGIVYGANVYQSNSIEYNPTDSSWNVSNVSDAINSLHSMVKELENIKSIGDATAAQILKGKTAVVKGNKITGTMKNMSNNWVWTNKGIELYTYSSGSTANMIYVSSREDHGDAFITTNTKFIVGTENDFKKSLLAGKTLLGVTGTATSDANAKASDIDSGKTAYVNGSKLTGTGHTLKTLHSWTANYGNFVNSDSWLPCPDITYSVDATDLYIIVRSEGGGTVAHNGSPTCTDGTFTLIANRSDAVVYHLSKAKDATFTLNIVWTRSHTTQLSATFKVYAIAIK